LLRVGRPRVFRISQYTPHHVFHAIGQSSAALPAFRDNFTEVFEAVPHGYSWTDAEERVSFSHEGLVK